MRTFLFLFYLSVYSLSWAVAEEANAKKTDDSLKLTTIPSGGGLDNEDDETSSDILIEDNPDYVPVEESYLEKGEDFSDSDSDDDDSDDDSDDDDGEDDAKSKMSKKLKKAKKDRVQPFKLLKKNRGKITIALAVFAFRKEIFMLLLHLFQLSASSYTPTGFLKLVLFVDFMRRMQTGGMSTGDESPSIRKTIGAMIDKTMDSNPAYVPPITQHFAFESLNEYYVKDGMALQKAIRKRHVGLKWPSSPTLSIASHFASSQRDSKIKNKTGTKTTADTVEDNGRTVVVLDWTKLDEQITSMNQLRQQIGFLLSEYRGLVMEGEQATNNVTMGNDDDDNSESSSPATVLEVVVLLESPGGSVSEYGLAGQHLLRLRNEPGITLTICVDKVAASGGYLLCCTASPGKLFAAPFALLGSIGVIATTINVNKLLTNWGIEPLEFRGGKYKAPIGMIGRVSKAGKRVTQTMIDDIHEAFKQHVVNARPILKNKIEEIGNGSVWLGVDAIDLGLVDSIKTSDEYIEEMVRDGTRVFKMVQAPRTGLLFGPRIGAFNTIDSKIPPAMKGPSTSTSSQEDVVEGLMQKSKTMMLRLPAHAKSMFSKSLQSFQ